ncbi:chloramphenicol phosphotransferase [Halobacillus rhizosphaerae]|uniref:chloramphenicol phosphotransferase CPT family protein n=1 Tax=Halobacillus rhizosphaerae TaxID=3064889 RepID=UPI00398A702B
MVQVIILNGGSSSGKTTIAKCLQNSLHTPWLRFSIDDLINAMPESMFKTASGLKLGDDGSVSPGPEFRTLESAWKYGIGEMVRKGALVIIDDVFISGVEARQSWETSLKGLEVLWVGVYCASTAASAREKQRKDRTEGMAAAQAEAVHIGIDYDIKVDTTHHSPESCAGKIKKKIHQ